MNSRESGLVASVTGPTGPGVSVPDPCQTQYSNLQHFPFWEYPVYPATIGYMGDVDSSYDVKFWIYFGMLNESGTLLCSHDFLFLKSDLNFL